MIKVARERNIEIGEEGWFKILQFLGMRVDEINISMMQPGISRINRIQFERLKDFITKRKYTILKLMPPSISLHTIMDRLSLDFTEIKKLYDYKVKAIRNDEKYLKLAKGILIHELNDVSIKVREQMVILSNV